MTETGPGPQGPQTTPPHTTPPRTPPTGAHRPFSERFIGALKLDAGVYDEVEHDPSAMGQAAAVVALGALAQGLAVVHGGFAPLVGGVIGGLLGWVFGTAVIWLIGVKWMDHTSDFQELLRTLGFASAPKLLLAIGVLPIGPLRPILTLAVAILTLIAFVIAVRQALDVSTGRAVWVCILGVVVSMLLGLLLGGLGAL
jgi:hypothetical protein